MNQMSFTQILGRTYRRGTPYTGVAIGFGSVRRYRNGELIHTRECHKYRNGFDEAWFDNGDQWHPHLLWLEMTLDPASYASRVCDDLRQEIVQYCQPQ